MLQLQLLQHTSVALLHSVFTSDGRFLIYNHKYDTETLFGAIKTDDAYEIFTQNNNLDKG